MAATGKRKHSTLDEDEDCKSRRLKVDTCLSSLLNGPTAAFAQPMEVGHFSVDHDRKVIPDRRNMKYISLPKKFVPLEINLSNRYDDWIQRDDVNVKEYLDPLLHWVVKGLLLRPQDTIPRSLQSILFSADFICWRGFLTRIASTPYENREGWIAIAIKWMGTIFLCEYDTDARKRQREELSGRDRLMTYWGYSFEQSIVADAPGQVPDRDSIIDTNEQYCSVFRSKIGDRHRLLCAGEVDCVDRLTAIDEPSIHNHQAHQQNRTGCDYVEIKTSRDFTHPRQEENFWRFKVLKWWLQSYFIGIPRIICGFRNDNGLVTRIKEFDVHDLPKTAEKMSRNSWRASAPLNFLANFLDLARGCVTESDPSGQCMRPYKAEWYPGQDGVTFEEITEDEAKRRFNFIPPWFVESVLALPGCIKV